VRGSQWFAYLLIHAKDCSAMAHLGAVRPVCLEMETDEWRARWRLEAQAS